MPKTQPTAYLHRLLEVKEIYLYFLLYYLIGGRMSVTITRPTDVAIMDAGMVLGKGLEYVASQLATQLPQLDEDTWKIVVGLIAQVFAYYSETKRWIPSEVNILLAVAGGQCLVTGAYNKAALFRG